METEGFPHRPHVPALGARRPCRRKEGWTRSTEDPAYGPWTSASWSTVNHAHAREPRSRLRAVDHGPVEAHGYDVAAP